MESYDTVHAAFHGHTLSELQASHPGVPVPDATGRRTPKPVRRPGFRFDQRNTAPIGEIARSARVLGAAGIEGADSTLEQPEPESE